MEFNSGFKGLNLWKVPSTSHTVTFKRLYFHTYLVIFYN